MPFEGLSDNLVMAAFYGCDDSAFAEIVRRWEKQLYWYFRRCGWSHEDAEELTQETLMKVYWTKHSGRGRYDPSRPFPAWIYRIAHNVAESRRRSERRRPRLVPLNEDATSENPSPDKLSELRDILDAMLGDLGDCLKKLPKREREFLALWEGAYGELSLTEIAEVWGISVPTVHRVKMRALAMLRKCLEAKGY